MNLGLLCGVNQDSVFFREGPTSGFLRSLVDVGMKGTGVGWGIQQWCEKRDPKGEWLLGVNRESSLCVSL